MAIYLIFRIFAPAVINKHIVQVKPSDTELQDRITFMTFIIPEFALTYKMAVQDAYRYLKKYGGLDYLYKHWWALHTDTPYWAIRSMFNICRDNGGLQ